MSESGERFQVEVYDREELFINQVQHVLRFDEESVTLMTTNGKVLIEGSGLVIMNLDQKSQRIMIKGSVLSIYFSKKDADKGKRTGRK